MIQKLSRNGHIAAVVVFLALAPARTALADGPTVELNPTEPATDAQSGNLPMSLKADTGNNWDVQQNGSLGDCGGNLFDSGNRLTVDGNDYPGVEQASVSAGSNLIAVGPQTVGAVQVTRRIDVPNGQDSAGSSTCCKTPPPTPPRAGW